LDYIGTPYSRFKVTELPIQRTKPIGKSWALLRTGIDVKHSAPVNAKKSLWSKLGAGLITGAADDDPSGIATYSQVGAAYGYATIWSLFLAMPLMVAIQTISARIGRATGKGIGSNMRYHYPRSVVYALILSVVIANVINLAADVGAMGAALKLLIGGPAVLYATGFALASLALQVGVPFSRYSPILKLLTLSLFAYVATVFVIHLPWGEVIKGTVLPEAKFDAKYTPDQCTRPATSMHRLNSIGLTPPR